jgi:hypothetical protein
MGLVILITSSVNVYLLDVFAMFTPRFLDGQFSGLK